jgi:hypothetical protein
MHLGVSPGTFTFLLLIRRSWRREQDLRACGERC